MKRLFALTLALLICLAPVSFAENAVYIDSVQISYSVSGGCAVFAPTQEKIQKINGADSSGEIVFDASGIAGAAGAALEFSPKWFASNKGGVTLISPSGRVTVSSAALKLLAEKTSDKVKLAFKSGELSIMRNNRAFEWYSYECPIVIAMPYETSEEKAAVTVVKDSGGAVVARSAFRDGFAAASVYTTGQYTVETVDFKGFGDTAGSVADDAASFLAARGVVTGRGLTGSGDNIMPYFAPEAFVTRAEFVTMLMRAMGVKSTEALTAKFPDVPEGAYFYGAVNTARSMGVTMGDDNGNFNPNALVSRQDVFTLTARAMDKAAMFSKGEPASVAYTDFEDISEYASASVVRLGARGLLEQSTGELRPLDFATRAEVALLLYKILNS